MNLLTTSLYVAFGGGLGAVFRYFLTEVFKHVPFLSGYVAIMIVNIIGCFFIGLLFLLLETRLRRDGKTRLPPTAFKNNLPQTQGLFNKDVTLQVVDHFRSDQRLRFLSGFLITGVLGGFTTFSAFCLYSVILYHEGLFMLGVINILLTPALCFISVIMGLNSAKKILVFTHN